MSEKILITSALPYANGALHFGHIAGAYLPADCYARFERLRGRDVLYICGSDEYGMAITLSAELEGRSPRAQADHFHTVNVEIFEKLHISFDHYSRTTCKEHVPVVQKCFRELEQNGHIEKRECAQLFSEKEGRFLADRYVEGTCPRCGFDQARGDECQSCGASYEATDLLNPRSKLTGSPLATRVTEHWFLRFDHFKEQLKQFISEKQWKSNVVAFAKHYVDELHARAITRDLEWGVPLTGVSGKVFYVWFDAPLGYISATQEWDSKRWKEFWYDPQTRYVQFMGKDNIPFHAIFFPAMLMGQNQPYKMVDELVANEFYNLEGKKFSKSEGWTIDLDDFFQKFTADQIRYTIAANAPETSDSEFTWADFQQKCNGDLLGKYGNLANRVLVFIKNKKEAIAPSQDELEPIDQEFVALIERIKGELAMAYASHRLRKAAALVMELATAGNVYFDAKMPWKEENSDTTLALCLHCLATLAQVSYPIIPQAAQKLWGMLGLEKVEMSWEISVRVEGKLPEPTRLFHKIEDDMIEQEMQMLQPFPPLKEQITFDQFEKLDLRVGEIIEVTAVKKSRKLLQLKVDIGIDVRQVVSGISEHYEPTELIGKRVIIVANLKPAKLMGIKSEGMILAGQLDGALEVAEMSCLPKGAVVS